METNTTLLNNNKRLLTVDITKGIGFFLVVLGHLVSVESKISVIIFSFHMPLFYLMSGYLMPTLFAKNKFIKREISLIINYIIFCVIGLLFSLIITSWRNTLTFKSLLFDVVFNTQPECIHVGQIWFLFSMLWATLFFYVTHFVTKNKEWLCLLIAIVISGISVVLSIFELDIYIYIYRYGLPFKLLAGMSAYVFIELGYIAKKKNLIDKIDKIQVLYKFIGFILLFIIICIVALYNGKVNIALGIYHNIFFYYLTSILGTLSIVLLSSCVRKIFANNIGYYGKNSLCFFSIHSLYLYAYAKLLSLITGNNYIIMKNLNYFQSIVGTILIFLFIIPFELFYNFCKDKVSRMFVKNGAK